MEITIKKCSIGDEKKAGEIYDKVTKYLTETINYPRWMYKSYPSTEYAATMIKSGSQYIIECDGKVVGAFVLNEDPSGSYCKVKWGADIKEGEYLIIHALAIDNDYSRRGIGKKVVEFCLDTARKNGYKAVRVDTVPENVPANNLYLSCGFTCFGDYDLDRPYDFKFFKMFEYIL